MSEIFHAEPINEKRDLELVEIIKKALDFHVKKAPGVIIGVYMTDLAMEKLPPLQGKMNAIVETPICLVDPVQLMTGCTLGNRYLWQKDWGRFALCLYDRQTKEGIRVFVNYDNIDAEETPTLKRFFDGTRTFDTITRQESQAIVVEEFYKVKRKILSWQRVWVDQPEKPELPRSKRCPKCNEFFKTTTNQTICTYCDTQDVYKTEPQGLEYKGK